MSVDGCTEGSGGQCYLAANDWRAMEVAGSQWQVVVGYWRTLEVGGSQSAAEILAILEN